MPAALSPDLRHRIVEAARDTPLIEVARRFSVSVSTVSRLRALARTDPTLAPRQTRFGPQALLREEHRAHFERYLLENVSMTHATMAARFADDTGASVSRQTIQRRLRSWAITRKKS